MYRVSSDCEMEIIKLKSGEEYQYKLKRTLFSSARFGNCEICKKFVETVYSLTEYKWDKADPEDNWKGGWLSYGCEPVKFGHKDCLKTQMKRG